MSNTVIKVEGLSKRYQLGTIGYGSLQHDLRAWWARARGKEDPNAKIGQKSRLDQHGEFWALRDVGFEVSRGDRVGIIGRNGAGKSTLLKVLSRVTAPTSGTIKVKGRIASLLEVGTGFHPELTGRENVFLNGAILGMKRREIEAKFDDIVDFAGVEQFIDTPVKRYSSGMYVRLAFSVAANLDSEILIIDEVLAVGDAEFQKKCLGKMEQVSKGLGRTILFVSHNLSAIKRLCDSGVYLQNGRVQNEGKIETVLQSYTAATTPSEDGDLSHRTDRQGKQLVLFQRVWLESPLGTPCKTSKSGSSLSLIFELENKENRPQDVHVSFAFAPAGAEEITNVSNFYEGTKLTIAGNSHQRYRCTLDELMLTEGTYHVNAYVGDGIDTQDWLSNVCELTVSFDDFYGSGQVPGSAWPMLLRSKWKTL